MKTVNFINQPDFETIEAAGIIFICDEKDYERLEKEFPAAFDDCFIVPNITTMSDLADYINDADEWPIDVENIIERNGWISDTGTEFGVCHNNSEKVIIDDEGKAKVI